MAAPTLDGTPATATFSSASSHAVSLTTTGTDDVIVVIVASEKNTGTFTDVSSISDTASLTWTRHAQLHWTPTANATHNCIEVWWAHAPAALTGDSITANLSQSTDDSCMVAFGVSGADFTTPFDTNASIPGKASDVTGSNTHPTVTGLTTNATDFMAIIMQANAQLINVATPAGYTSICSLQNGLGSLEENLDVDYQGISGSAWSSQTVDYGANSNNWGMIATAIRAPVAEADVTASPALGAGMAATVDVAQSVVAAPALGISEAATVTLETSIIAAVALGLTESASFADFTEVAASMSLGISEAAAIELDEDTAANAALGVSMAAAVALVKDFTAASGLGVSMRVSFGTSRIRQPVINCCT